MRACGPVPNWRNFGGDTHTIFQDNGGGSERANRGIDRHFPRLPKRREAPRASSCNVGVSGLPRD